VQCLRLPRFAPPFIADACPTRLQAIRHACRRHQVRLDVPCTCPPWRCLRASQTSCYSPRGGPVNQYVQIRIFTRTITAGHAPILSHISDTHLPLLSRHLRPATSRRPGRRKQSALTCRYPETGQTLREQIDSSARNTRLGAIPHSGRGIHNQDGATDPRLATTGKGLSAETIDEDSFADGAGAGRRRALFARFLS
jgi:hypothetical protein